MSNLYNFKIIIPADPNQTDAAVRYALKEKGNFFIGMGRAKMPVVTDEKNNVFFDDTYEFEYGKADLLRQGKSATIIAMGSVVPEALSAWEILSEKGIGVNVFNVATPDSIDIEMLKRAVENRIIFTVENHNVNTGLGVKISNALIENGLQCKIVKLGVSHYTTSDKPSELYKLHGLDAKSIVERIIKEI